MRVGWWAAASLAMALSPAPGLAAARPAAPPPARPLTLADMPKLKAGQWVTGDPRNPSSSVCRTLRPFDPRSDFASDASCTIGREPGGAYLTDCMARMGPMLLREHLILSGDYSRRILIERTVKTTWNGRPLPRRVGNIPSPDGHFKSTMTYAGACRPGQTAY